MSKATALLRVTVPVRWAAVCLASWAIYFPEPLKGDQSLFVTLMVLGFIHAGTAHLLSRRETATHELGLVTFGDLILTTAGVYVFGGPGTFLVFFYIMVVLFAAAMWGLPGGFFAATAAATLLAAMGMLTDSYAPGSVDSRNLALAIAAMYLCAWLTHSLVQAAVAAASSPDSK